MDVKKAKTMVSLFQAEQPTRTQNMIMYDVGMETEISAIDNIFLVLCAALRIYICNCCV